MRRNDKGIAVPDMASPLPWNMSENRNGSDGRITDANGGWVVSTSCLNDAGFIRHAANYHERNAEIVRRLAIYARETSEPNHPSPTYKLTDIKDDALRLWNDMRKDGE